MSNQIKFNDIKKQNKKYEEKKRVELSDGTHLFIYPHFSKLKLAELVKEMMNDKILAEEKGIKFSNIDSIDWGFFSIIYKFSDLGIPKEITKKVEAFYHLMEWDLLSEVITAYPEESLKSYAEFINNYATNLEKIIDETSPTVDEVTSLIEKQLTKSDELL